MKITNEQFNKLKQLDRIELRQRQDMLLRYYKRRFSVMPLLIFGFVYVFLSIIVLAILTASPNVIYYVNEISYLLLLIKKVFVLSVLSGILEGLLVILHQKKLNKKLEELENEYFKIENKK